MTIVRRVVRIFHKVRVQYVPIQIARTHVTLHSCTHIPVHTSKLATMHCVPLCKSNRFGINNRVWGM